MYFVVKALIRSMLLPPAINLILAAAGGLLLWRGRRIGRVLVALALVTLWLFSTPVTADWLSRLAERYPPLDLGSVQGAQAIVIIGGGGERDFAPEFQGPAAESGLLERLSYGAFVARRTGLPVLVSGAPKESMVMQTSLARDFGVSVRWREGESRDTFENARFSAHILQPAGITHIILVTSATHLWRAAHEFQGAGFQVSPAPVGLLAPREDGPFQYVPSPAALMRSNLAMYELIGEPMRLLQEALGVRERFDRKAAAAVTRAPSAGPDFCPNQASA